MSQIRLGQDWMSEDEKNEKEQRRQELIENEGKLYKKESELREKLEKEGKLTNEEKDLLDKIYKKRHNELLPQLYKIEHELLDIKESPRALEIDSKIGSNELKIKKYNFDIKSLEEQLSELDDKDNLTIVEKRNQKSISEKLKQLYSDRDELIVENENLEKEFELAQKEYDEQVEKEVSQEDQEKEATKQEEIEQEQTEQKQFSNEEPKNKEYDETNQGNPNIQNPQEVSVVYEGVEKLDPNAIQYSLDDWEIDQFIELREQLKGIDDVEEANEIRGKMAKILDIKEKFKQKEEEKSKQGEEKKDEESEKNSEENDNFPDGSNYATDIDYDYGYDTDYDEIDKIKQEDKRSIIDKFLGLIEKLKAWLTTKTKVETQMTLNGMNIDKFYDKKTEFWELEDDEQQKEQEEKNFTEAKEEMDSEEFDQEVNSKQGIVKRYKTAIKGYMQARKNLKAVEKQKKENVKREQKEEKDAKRLEEKQAKADQKRKESERKAEEKKQRKEERKEKFDNSKLGSKIIDIQNTIILGAQVSVDALNQAKDTVSDAGRIAISKVVGVPENLLKRIEEATVSKNDKTREVQQEIDERFGNKGKTQDMEQDEDGR